MAPGKPDALKEPERWFHFTLLTTDSVSQVFGAHYNLEGPYYNCTNCTNIRVKPGKSGNTVNIKSTGPFKCKKKTALYAKQPDNEQNDLTKQKRREREKKAVYARVTATRSLQ